MIRVDKISPYHLRQYKKKHPQWVYIVFRRNDTKGMRRYICTTKRRAWKQINLQLELFGICYGGSIVSDTGRALIIDDRHWKRK